MASGAFSLDDLDPEPNEGSDPFDRLDSEFKQTYGRPLTFTGRDTDTHVRLHGPGQARDIRVRDLDGDQIKFILNRGPELGLSLRDYSKAKPHTTKTGVRITGPHIHAKRGRGSFSLADIEGNGPEAPAQNTGTGAFKPEDLSNAPPEAPAVSLAAPPASVSGVQPVAASPAQVEAPQGQPAQATIPGQTVDVQAGDDANLEGDVYREWTNAMKSGDFGKASQAAQIYEQRFPKGGQYARYIYDPVSGVNSVPLGQRKEAREGAVAIPIGDLVETRGEAFRQAVEQRFKQALGFDDATYQVFKERTGFDPAKTAGYGQGREQIKQTPEEFEASVRGAIGEDGALLIRVPKASAEKIQEFFNDKSLADPSLAQAEAVNPKGRAGVAGLVEKYLGKEFTQGTQQLAAGMTQGMVGTMGGAAKSAGVLLREGARAIDADSPTPISDMLIGSGDWLNRFTQSASFAEADPDGAALSSFKLGQGLGSGATFALTGVAGRVGAGVAGALSQAGSSYDETYKRLIESGFDKQQAHEAAINAAILNVPIGFTEMFGVGGSLERALAGGVAGAGFSRNLLGAIVKGAVEEGISQERLQTRLGNIVAQVSGDPNRKLSEGEASGVLVGLLTGGLMDGGTMAAVGKETTPRAVERPSVNLLESQPGRPSGRPGIEAPVQRKEVQADEKGSQELPTRAERPTGETGRKTDTREKGRQEDVATKGAAEKVAPAINPKVLGHVAGPSGAGKTELANALGKSGVKNIALIDLDAFDDAAVKRLGYDKIRKDDFTDAMLNEVHAERQKIVDKFIEKSRKPVVFFGHHIEGDNALDLHTDNKILLDVPARTAALRANRRPGKVIGDVARDTRTGEQDIETLRAQGYQPTKPSAVFGKVRDFSKAEAAKTKAAAIVAEEPARVAGVQGIVKRARENERRAVAEGAVDQATGLQSKNSWVKAQTRIDADPAQEVAVLDVNDLKKFNDQIGHDAGDAYLAHVGKVTLEEAEKAGVSPRQVFRSGGDEVVIAAPKGKAQALVARIKERVAEFEREGIKGSIAAGVGQTTKVGDAMMYRDKQKMKEAAARTAIVKQATAPAIEKAQGRVEMVSLLKKGFSRDSIVKMKPEERTRYAGMETPRLVYRARSVGDTGVKTGSKSQATSSLAKAREYAVSRASAKDVGGKQQEVVAIDVTKLPRGSYEFAPAPDGQLWFNTKTDISESAVTVERRGRERAPGEKKPETKPTKPRDAFAAAVKARLPQKLFQKGRLSQEDAQEAYDKADAEFRTVSQAYREATRAYRAREIGDTEFLKAKSALTEASAKFDAAETALINSPKPKPAKAESTQGRLFQKNDTPLLTAIRRAGGIDPNTQEGRDIARYFSRREGGQGLMIQGGAKIDQLVRALREEEGFPFTEEDDPNHSPVSELLAAMQQEAEGKPFRSYEDVATDFEYEAEQFFAEEQGIANVEDFRIINNLASEAWFELHAKVINENTEPTEAEVARFRTLSNAIKLSPGAIEDFIEAGRVGRSGRATEFFTEDDRDAVALERAKIEAEAESRRSDYDRIPLPVEVKTPLLEIARKFVRDKRTDYDALVQEYQDILGDDFILVADHLPTVFAHVAPAEQEVAQNVTELKAIVVDPSNAADLEGGPLTESELKWIAERRRRDVEFQKSREVALKTGGGEVPRKGSGVRSPTAARKGSRVAEKIPRPTTATNRAEFKAALIKNWGYLEEVAHRASEIMEALASQYAVDAKASNPKIDTATAKRSVYERVKIANGPATGETLQQTDRTKGLPGEDAQPKAEPVLQTDTPEFRRWFGDSKVVDEKGKPLALDTFNHGKVFVRLSSLTPPTVEDQLSRLEKIRLDRQGFFRGEANRIGINFGENRIGTFASERYLHAESYGTVKLLVPSRALRLFDTALKYSDADELVNEFALTGSEAKRLAKAVLERGLDGETLARSVPLYKFFDDRLGEIIRNKLKRQGYDGISFPEVDPGERAQPSVILFEGVPFQAYDAPLVRSTPSDLREQYEALVDRWSKTRSYIISSDPDNMYYADQHPDVIAANAALGAFRAEHGRPDQDPGAVKSLTPDEIAELAELFLPNKQLKSVTSSESSQAAKTLPDKSLDPNGPSDLKQDAFGATSFTKTGEAVIHGFQANPSTAPHELVHAVLPLIADLANQPSAPATLKIAVRDLVTAGGFKDTAEYLRQHQAWISDAASAEDKTSYNDGSEKIARGFEGYLNEGKAPTKALESAFAKFKEWLSKIYRHIREDMQLTDRQRRAWDRLLGSEREKAASKIDEQEHWNWGRSSFASPQVETNFRAIVREAAVESGGQHKIPVSRQAHLERVGNLAPDLLPEIKGLRENLIVSREVFTAAAEYAQTLTRQAQELRDLITPSTLPDEALRLEDRIAALEHDATEVMSHTIGVRSEFGRNLALLAAQKTDQLSPERVLAYGQSLAEQRGMDKTSQTWKTRARKLVGLSNGIQAAEKQKKKLERERKKIEEGKAKKEPRKPWQTVMLEGLQSQAAEAQARLAAQYGARLEQADDTQLFQKRDIPTAANDIATILAARIAEEGQKKTGTDLTRMVEDLRSSFPDIVNEYEPQIKEAADTMLREARRSALLAAARDPQQKVSVRQQLAKDVSDAKKVENEADRQLATKTRQMDAMFERDSAQAAKEATEKWDRANADWQRMMDESQKAAEEAEKQAVALGEKQKAAGETAEQKRLREEWINEAKDRKENWLAGEREFARQQRAAIVDEARRLKRAEIEAEKDRLRSIAEDAREQTRASRAAIAEAARLEGRWDYPVTQAAENARANLADPNHAPTVEELGAVMAEKSLQDGMTPQRLHREMGGYGKPYTENARKVRDAAASMKADARESFAQRRLEERAAGQAAGATNIAGQRQARADYQTWEARRLEEITQELAYQNRIIRTNRRDMARELARLQKVSALDRALDLIGLPRSLASSVDLPHLRQGLPTLMNHPTVWFESFVKSTSTWTAAQMETRLDEMEASPLADLARLSGLKQSGLESRRAPLSRLAREEQFQNRFAEKFPHVRVSQRQYTTGMDVMRLKTFELHADRLLAEYPPAANPEIYSELARIVNIMTGVGDIGSATQFAPFLNHFLFATRFMVSRFQLLSMLRAPLHYRGQPPAIRKIAAQEAWGYVGKMSLLFGTAAALGLTSLDPDDDDFLKFQIPGTSQKWDFTGGLGGYVGTLFKLARGAYRAGTGERSFKGDSFGDTAERFVRSKLAPAPATLWDWKTGRTFIGEPFSWKSKSADLALPMMARELYDAIKIDGARGAVMIPYALLGGNVSAYRSRKLPHRTGSRAERYATGMLRERMGEKPETTEDYKRRTLITELAVAMKTENQRNVARITQEIEQNGGPLSAKEKESVEDRVEKTPLQRAYKYLGTAEKQAVLDVATPEEALSLEKNAGSITDRLKDLIESPEYKAMNETQRKNALKQTAQGARKGLPEAETEFVIDRTEARAGVIEKLKARDDFKALSEDDQDSVVRSVNGLFQKLSIKKEDHGKPDVIRRKTRLLDDLLRRGTFEREIDRILREQQRKAA